MRKWLSWLGPNHLQRIRAIDALFEQRNATIWSEVLVCSPSLLSAFAAAAANGPYQARQRG